MFTSNTFALLCLIATTTVSTSLHHRSTPTCTHFTQKGENYSIPAPDTQRVSIGLTCANTTNKTCPIVADGTVTESSSITTDNTILSDGAQDALYDSIGSLLHAHLGPEISGTAAKNQTFHLSPGQSGYVGFTAYMICTNGSVEGCAQGFEISNGTHVTVCKAGFDATGMLAGDLDVVTTDAQSVVNMTTNPHSNATGEGRSGAARWVGGAAIGKAVGAAVVGVGVLVLL